MAAPGYWRRAPAIHHSSALRSLCLKGNYPHSTRHIIGCASKYIWPMGTPLNFADSVLVTAQHNLTNTSNLLCRFLDRRSARWWYPYHPAVPDLDCFINPSTRQRERSVLVPIQRQDLHTRCWYGQCSEGNRRIERPWGCGSGCVRGTARNGNPEVEDLQGPIRRAGSQDIRMMRGKKGLINTCVVRS